MGRPSKDDALPPYTEEAEEEGRAETASLRSAVSLQPYDDVPDLPAYTDDPQLELNPTILAASTRSRELLNSIQGAQHTSNPTFSSDPDALFALVLAQSALPPRPTLRFQGHHNERQRERSGKEEVKLVTDFDLQLDCRDLLVFGEDGVMKGANWAEWYTVPDDIKAHRGHLFQTRARAKLADIEVPDLPNSTPIEAKIQALRSWCHIFTTCATRTRFPYTFTLQRRVTNWDTDLLRTHLTAMVRQTNYRGNPSIAITTKEDVFTVYSDHWMNRARNNRYIYWTCIILQLWILAWPILWFCTGKFAIAKADWPYKKPVHYSASREPWRYASISEQQFLETWGYVLADAAFARRQGCIGREDYERVMKLRQASRENATVLDRRLSGNRVVDTAVGIFAGISRVREERDRALGWGADEGGSSLSVNFRGLRSGFNKRIMLH